MNIILFVLGAAAVYLIQMGLCKLFWNYKLNGTVFFSEKEAREGDTIQLIATVQNQKTIPIITVKVNVALDRGLEFLDQNNLAVSDKNYRSEIFSLRGNEEVKREIPLFCAKRGYYSIDQIDFIGNDLFYTKRFLSSQQVNSSICILPGKANAKQLMVATQKMTGETVVPRSDCDDPFTFRGIRQYQNFDSIRDINWKASAKTGDLRVNIHDFTADQEVVILLDSEWDTLLKPDSLLEESIRIAASISDELVGKGIMTSLLTNGRNCISDQVIQIPAGAHSQHSHSIQYALARLKIQNEIAVPSLPALLQDQTERMDAQPNRKLSWVLISTQTNQQVIAAWKELRQRAVKSYWIFPAYSRSELPEEMQFDPDIIYWEVAYGK